MTWRFWVPGPLPGMNEIIALAKIGGNGQAYAAKKAKLTSDIAFIAMAAKISKGLERIRCHFEWVERTKCRNPDNIEAGQKFVWDSLQVAKVIENDGWSQNAGSSHSHSIGNTPGVWVTVEEVPHG
jgi:hypothetical protein